MDLALLVTEPASGGASLLLKALLLLILVAVSAFFSGAEVALISMGKLRRRQLVEEGRRGAAAVAALMERPNRMLITVLIGNNLVNIGAAALATSVAIGLFGSTGVGVATGVMTLLILTFGEITPKAIATQRTEGYALAAAPVLRGLQRALWPAVVVFEAFTGLVFRAFGAGAGEAEAAFRDQEELKRLVSLGAEEGVLEEEAEEMIHSVLEFGELTSREVMVPRGDVVAVSADTPVGEARRLSVESGFSRIPVYEGDLDHVVGVLYVKDVLNHLVEGGEAAPAREVMKPPYVVPEAKKLGDLLREMRDKRVHLAVVVDEFGGTAGVVTLEDVLEEIVGDIFDEYDPRREPIVRVDARTALVDGRAHVDDVNRALGTRLPEDAAYGTVAGFVVHALGRLGREGESVSVDGHRLTVLKVANRRILRVRVVAQEGAEGGAVAAEETRGAAEPPGSGETPSGGGA